MGQRSGPREVLPDGSRTALAQASLSDGGGRRYARVTSSCLIFRP
jgi:acyl-coenzyme A thioesterase PaaI-like protein